MAKKIIVIHGRDTMPAASAHKELCTAAIVNGLQRVDPSAARHLNQGSVEIIFAYFGDINNALLGSSDPDARIELTARNDERYGFEPCLDANMYAAPLRQLMQVDSHDGLAYGSLVDLYRSGEWLDEAASVVSRVASWTGLSEHVIKWATADMSQYLHTRKIGSDVRERLQFPLKQSLLEQDDICLISHSMGAIVSYDVLWKFSRMSEYRSVQQSGNQINLWLTLGSPLGEPGVRNNLYDANERGEDRFPREIVKRWVNIAAEDDYVAHDATMANDFAEMRELGFIEKIIDRQIYNFWVKDDRLNPHNLFGYLDHPETARFLAQWITSTKETEFIDPGPSDSSFVVERMVA